MIKIAKLTATITALLLSFLLISCSEEKKEDESKSQGVMLDLEKSKPSASNENVAGISWSIPETWTKGKDKTMRIATYTSKGSTPAECAVFYFGAEQGGNVDANIDRWINQIEQPDGSASAEKAVKSTLESSCCKIKLVEVDGTYLSSSGPMMKVVDAKLDYTLLAAIVSAPEGNVFFKLTGPRKIVKSESENFLTMLKAIE